jgi:hypothetical protein
LSTDSREKIEVPKKHDSTKREREKEKEKERRERREEKEKDKEREKEPVKVVKEDPPVLKKVANVLEREQKPPNKVWTYFDCCVLFFGFYLCVD